MTTAVRRTLTVSPQGRLELLIADLSPGSKADVIVLIESEPTTPAPTIAPRLAALVQLQQCFNPSDEQLQTWQQEVWDGRHSRRRLPGDKPAVIISIPII